MTSSHWGEMPVEPLSDFFIPDVSEDIEKSMDDFCLEDYEEDDDDEEIEQIKLPQTDPLTLYAISLHKFMNEITEMIELTTEMNVIPSEDAKPPLPELQEIPVKHKPNNINFVPKEFTSRSSYYIVGHLTIEPHSPIALRDENHFYMKFNILKKSCRDFVLGKEIEVPELSEDVAKKVLEKCVATLFAHIGFETTHKSVLDILTDVLEDLFHKFGMRLVQVNEDDGCGEIGGFPGRGDSSKNAVRSDIRKKYAVVTSDPYSVQTKQLSTKLQSSIERVLTELGLGGVKGLNDYYQSRVVKYVNVLQRRCQELDNHYASLLIPKPGSLRDIDKLIKIEVKQEDSLETENPELHFATLDSGVCSTLEPGYQLLNSLEAETNLQSLAETEEEMSTSSPSIVSIPPDADICDLSPFIKKKRFK